VNGATRGRTVTERGSVMLAENDSLSGEPATGWAESKIMVDRDKILSVLHKRFPGASQQQVA
jgi:hypothetical protein